MYGWAIWLLPTFTNNQNFKNRHRKHDKEYDNYMIHKHNIENLMKLEGQEKQGCFSQTV